MQEIRTSQTDSGVVTLELNRPQKNNAITAAMWHRLREELNAFSISPTGRVLVITGAGEAFCAGADLSSHDPDQTSFLGGMREISEIALALHRIAKPVIAKVNGVAAGAGCNLALGCDLVVAAEGASFTEIFVRRGLSLDFGGSWLLPRLIGLHRSKELAFLGDRLSAREAERWGLVNRVVESAELDATVAQWAERLALGPPLALSLNKRLLDDAFGMSFAESLEMEGLAQCVNLASQDSREAIQAFFAKRDPRFSGR